VIKKVTAALALVLALLLPAACGASRTSCTNGVCVQTDPDGLDHVWPEPVPEPTGLAKKPGPVRTDSKGKKLPAMTIPPGAPVNPQPSKTKQARRVEFHMKRTEQTGATVEIEWAINGQHVTPIPAYAQGGWRQVEWLNPGASVHLWISRNPGNKATIRCWITVNGKIPSPAGRPDGVPMFAADGSSKSPFDCYVSAWIT
jgi:hypothetical protein